MLLQFTEKCHHQWGVDLLDIQARGRLMQALLCKRQELTKSVPIGTDGVRAGLALLHQAL